MAHLEFGQDRLAQAHPLQAFELAGGRSNSWLKCASGRRKRSTNLPEACAPNVHDVHDVHLHNCTF